MMPLVSKIDKCYALYKCDHCCKPGHKIDKFYALHGCPLRSVVVVQTYLYLPSSTRDLPSSVSSDTPAMFNKFLKWYKINSLLVSLHLSHTQVHLLLV